MKLNSKKTGLFILLTTAIMSLNFLLVLAQTSASWKAPETAKQMKNPVVVDSSSVAAGKITYMKECSKCHGNKGMGDGPNAVTLDKAPLPLNSKDVKSQTDGELFWKITEGKKPMPATKTTLTAVQHWQLVNFIRKLGNPSSKN